MRGNICRGLRLKLVAGFGLALASLGAHAAAEPVATATRLTADSHIVNNRTQGVFSVSVTGDDGEPARGAVVLEDGGKSLAGAALDSNGNATLTVDLASGDHSIRAVYQGDQAHTASVSGITAVSAATTGSTPDFQISVNPASMSLTQGQSGTATVSLTPVNASALTSPMFVTLSCSGFPDQSSCNFTPENVQILPNATTAVTSDMVVLTQAQGTRGQLVRPGGANPVAWAILLPGVLGFAGLAFAARRNRFLSRLSLIALVAFVAALGTTACAPRYNYYNHGPPYNLPTPAGTYTMQVTAQSSNGVTATTHSTTFALTVTTTSTN